MHDPVDVQGVKKQLRTKTSSSRRRHRSNITQKSQSLKKVQSETDDHDVANKMAGNTIIM